MTKLELLAPAKNLECGIAAIDHGADAVYIGASRFGARVAAGNSVEDIHQLCDYAHLFGVRVYVTINTIIYDGELEAIRQLIKELKNVGVDAVLIQDMALIEFLKDSHLCYHASTQADNRTAEKVQWLYNHGFSRAVLARELSVDEIAAVHRSVPDMELEVFVHGALCVSFSGLCYASQHCFARSANRGECAQFCRMKFSLIDAVGREIEHDRHLLSLKDLNLYDNLEELVEAGATSFKIEGRLKDITYVKNVTAAYSKRLDDIVSRHSDRYCRSSLGRCNYTFLPNLNKTFNRSYTTYFLHGRQPDIASFDTPKAVGEFVGVVKGIRSDSFCVAGLAGFTNGDGLCFLNTNRQLEGFRVNRVVGNRIYPYGMPKDLRHGTRLYRNNDRKFERLLTRQSAVRKIPVVMTLGPFDDGKDWGFELSVGDGQRNVSVRIHVEREMAKKSQREQIIRELSKLGSTPYECSQVILPDYFPWFIPASRLSELRHAAVKQLLDMARGQDTGVPKPNNGASSNKPIPYYAFSYLYNISNRLAAAFYGTGQSSAYELQGGEGPLMQCRHCIRYALGYCVKYGGKHPQWREPLFLQLSGGKRFRLEFDCQHCQMNIYA